MRKSFLALMAIILLFASQGRAEVIFFDDFQDGQADGWQAMGKGDVRLTEYQKNISLFMSQTAAVITVFSTKGYEKVSVSLSFAAKSLEDGEYCIGEVSGDQGQSWHEVNRVGDGQDDAVTLHTGSLSSDDLNDRDKVYLRVRVAGNKANDICWLDNVRVIARKIRLLQNNDSSFPATRLMDGQLYDRPVDMSFFAPTKQALAPEYPFEGKVTFAGKARVDGFDILKDSFHYGAGKAASLPDFSFAFVSSGGDIIPQRRGLILTDHAWWDIILEPGKVWNEPGEEYSRASIPFSLQEKNANCTHNGVMTFLYNDQEILSKLAFQISSETCLYYKFDMWGYQSARYQPGPVEGKAEIIEAYQKEKSSRLPVKPLVDIARDYPGLNSDNFGSVSEIDPDHMTAFGIIVDGIHYAGGCETRYGNYPFCDVMDLPSYSTAKSLFGGLALMRMEKLYPGIKDEKIADYIPACKKFGGWADVSFLDALNMTTGHYGADKYMVDEGSKKMINFFDALTHEDKIKTACRAFKRKSRPGLKWVYHTSDTYILGTALQDYLKQKQGIEADIYQDILGRALWKELALSPVLDTTRRTSDHRAQPFTGYGLTYHRDDVARIAVFLNSENGFISDFFDSAEIDKALQRNNNDRGIFAYGKAIRYKNGFWASDFQKILGCKKPVWVPFMSGYGGITIALLPNGMVYYYFSDNDDFAWKFAVLEAHKIKNLCKLPFKFDGE